MANIPAVITSTTSITITIDSDNDSVNQFRIRKDNPPTTMLTVDEGGTLWLGCVMGDTTNGTVFKNTSTGNVANFQDDSGTTVATISSGGYADFSNGLQLFVAANNPNTIGRVGNQGELIFYHDSGAGTWSLMVNTNGSTTWKQYTF